MLVGQPGLPQHVQVRLAVQVRGEIAVHPGVILVGAHVDVLAGGPLAGAVQRFRTAGGNFAISLAAKDLRLAHRDAPGTPVAEAALTRLGELSDQDADVTAIV